MELVEARFDKFRRALRKPDQALVDELFRYARFHVQAGVLAANPNPIDSMLFSMMIEQQRHLKKLEQHITDLQNIIKEGSEHGNQRLSV